MEVDNDAEGSRREARDGPSSNNPWRDYLTAARRKVEIASHNFNQLKAAVAQAPDASPVPISVQAAFEGVLTAIVAASDQVAEALNIGYGLELENPNLQTVIEEHGSVVPTKLKKWQQHPAGAHLRRLRRLAVHHSYMKRLTPDGYVVHVPGRDPTAQPAEIPVLRFAENVERHGRSLLRPIDDVEAALNRRSAGAT